MDDGAVPGAEPAIVIATPMNAALRRELRDATRLVLGERADGVALRAAAIDPEHWQSLWTTAVELGWPALGVPEHHGGVGLGLAELVILAEECGRHLVAAPLVSTSMAVAAIGAGRDGDAALERIAGGTVATFSHAASAPSLVEGRLVGTAALVADARRAETFVVIAIDDRGDARVVVTRAGENVEIGPDAGPDVLRSLSDVRFDVEPEAVLDASAAIAVARARVVLSGELVGVASRALELAVEHATSREQFGRAIGSFQGVKHPLATCWVAREKAVALVGHAVGLLEEFDPSTVADAVVASAMAKAAANDAALDATKQGVQTLGALGITSEHDMAWLLRRARQAVGLLGDSRAMYRLVGESRCSAATASAFGTATS